MLNKLKKLLVSKDFINIFLYGVIGVLAAVVDFTVFTVCVELIGIHNILANLISMHMGMIVSFTLNSCFNFKKTDKLFRRFLSYYAIVLVGMGISSLLIGVLSNFMPVLIVKVISMVVVSIIQYLLNRFITYRF